MNALKATKARNWRCDRMARIELTEAERDTLAALCEAAVEANFDSGEMMRLLLKACELKDHDAIRAVLEKLVVLEYPPIELYMRTGRL